MASDLKILENVTQSDIQEMSALRNQTESNQNEINEEVIQILNERINRIMEKYIIGCN